MKIIISLLFLISFTQTAFAKCTLRHYVDPLFEKSVEKSVNKAIKRKGYKLLKMSDEFFEDYRLVLSFHPNSPDGAHVRFYMQIFEAPNFKDLFQVRPAATQENFNEIAMSLLKDIPQCED